jgi:hypothetical protein
MHSNITYIISGSVYLLVTFGIPVAFGYWYGYEKGKNEKNK